MMYINGIGYAEYSLSVMPIPPKDGSRVEISSGSEISEERALELMDYVRHKAGKEGQVSVRKPSPKLGGVCVPFIIDNLDGKGPIVNRDFFPD